VIRALISCLLTVAALGIGGCSDLRKSEAAIVDALEIETPLGATKNQVRQLVVEKGRGPIVEESNSATVSLKDPFATKDWHSLFRVRLGNYGFPGIRTDVVAFYVFNEAGNLVEISVIKEHDSV
jgi:hypothetical protein